MVPDGKLVVEVAAQPEEFAAICLENTSGSCHVRYAIEKAITGYITGALEKYPFVSNIKYRTSRLPYSLSNSVSLEDFINAGYFALQWYEFTFDCAAGSGIDGIDFVFTGVLALENSLGVSETIYVKKKTLVTKETYKIRLREIRIDGDALVKINRSIADGSFGVFVLEKDLKKYGYHTGKNGVTVADYSDCPPLPMPIIICPPTGGAFIGFKTDAKSVDMYFCSCAKTAIENHAELNWLKENGTGLNMADFPDEFTAGIRPDEIINNTGDILKHFHFRDKICHECNGKAPGIMSEIIVDRYIGKQFYEYGIDLLSGYAIVGKLPGNIRKIIYDAYPEYADKEKGYIELKNVSDRKTERKLYRVMANEIKKEVLSVLRFKKPAPRPLREYIFAETAAIRPDAGVSWFDMGPADE
jgi:hypothetical protein